MVRNINEWLVSHPKICLCLKAGSPPPFMPFSSRGSSNLHDKAGPFIPTSKQNTKFNK
jgi:hypothetical protein